MRDNFITSQTLKRGRQLPFCPRPKRNIAATKMARMKEAIVLVLDVSPAMVDSPNGSETSLSKSLEAINMIVLRRMFLGSKDELALVAFGTEETNNPLAESLEGYQNISIVHQLELPSIEFLRKVKDDISIGTTSADFVDAIIVAMDHLMDKTRGRKMGQQIILFSNLTSEFSTDNLQKVIQSMKKTNVQVRFIGPKIQNNEDDSNSESDESMRETSNNRDAMNDGNNETKKPLTSQQLEGIRCIKEVLEQVDGKGMSFADVLPMLAYFQTRFIKQTTVFRGPIEIGDTMKVNVYGYVKVKEMKADSFKKMSALSQSSRNPGDMKVTVQTSHHLQDEDFTEIDDRNVAKAYRYGKTLVPYSKIDEQSLKMETERCLKVLGFTDRSNINESHYLGESVYFFVPQPGDGAAAIALSALVHALEEKNMVAIARYCRCKNANPKLVVLIPEIKFHHEGLYMFILPFAEDLRRFSFASLDAVNVTDEQLNAVDSLIDGMDLTKAARNEDGGTTEAFKPKKLLNPLIQRQCQCIQRRALNPDDDGIPEMDTYIKRSFEVLPEHAANCSNIVEKLKEVFPLSMLDKKSSDRKKNLFQRSDEKSEPERKMTKLSDEKQDDMGFRCSSLLQDSVMEVGTVHPVTDYENLIRNADAEAFGKASSQMANRVLQLVNDSFLDQYYQKALECIKKFRQESVKANSPDVFNDLLQQIKCSMMGNRRNDFWILLQSEHISLISCAESNKSEVTVDFAMQFFGEEREEKVADIQMTEEEDADDLLDMM